MKMMQSITTAFCVTLASCATVTAQNAKSKAIDTK